MTFNCDVLIVGAGPVGLMGAHLLARQGLSTLIVEKYPSRLSIPKAHALNPRSLEICAGAGLPIEAFYAAGTPADEGGLVRFMTTLSGKEIGQLPYERQDEAVRAFTPYPLVNIAQPKFQDILEKSLPSTRFLEVRKSTQWLSYEETIDGVVSTLCPRGGSTRDNYKIKSRYIIAADGAMSTVRDYAGINLSGDEGLAHCVTIHFEADLTSLIGDRPAILYFLFGVKRGAALIAYDVSKTWVLMHRYDPALEPAEAFSQEDYRRAITAALGVEVDVDIKGASPWTMSSQVADEYRRGRLFLAGDAAHRFPPTGGLGLNTGLGDIDNLVWKIAAVEKGWASSKLLDSYQAERKYVAQINAAQSTINAKRMRVLNTALGQGPNQATSENRSDADIVMDLVARVSDPANKNDIADGVEMQKQHFDSLRLQLGYIYGENRDLEIEAPIDVYTPKSIIGAHLPHHALKGSVSVLDLVESCGLTLLMGPEAIVPDTEAAQAFHIAKEGVDFHSEMGGWASTMKLPPDGALILRPDRHILWRCETSQDWADMNEAIASYLYMMTS